MRIKIYCFFALLLAWRPAKDYLRTTPTDSVSASAAFSTTANAWAALNGIHRSLYIKYYGQQDEGGQGANMAYVDICWERLVNTTRGQRLVSTHLSLWTAHRAATGTVPYSITVLLYHHRQCQYDYCQCRIMLGAAGG